MERGTERGGTLEAGTGRNGVERLIVMAGLERLMEAHPNKLFFYLCYKLITSDPSAG